jgi:hypothetical protein
MLVGAGLFAMVLACAIAMGLIIHFLREALQSVTTIRPQTPCRRKA